MNNTATTRMARSYWTLIGLAALATGCSSEPILGPSPESTPVIEATPLITGGGPSFMETASTEASVPPRQAPAEQPQAEPRVIEPEVIEPGVPEPGVTEPGIAVKPSHPDVYTVVRGDTLWDIAAHFLRDPWVWPEIWQVNPQINNPHLIYPGDRISLIYMDGRPRLYVERPDAMDSGGASSQVVSQSIDVSGNKVVKLSPRVRAHKLGQAIPSIAANAIQQFTVKPRVVTKEELDGAPYIIGNYDGRLISATGHQVYARGIADNQETLYSVYRPGDAFVDPDTGEILGYEVKLVGDAKVLDFGDPATLVITDNNRETLAGDRLFPADKGRTSHNYVPRVPDITFNGRVIRLYDAVSQVAQNQVVAINLGQRDGIEVGDILAVERHGQLVRDPYSTKRNEKVKLPAMRAGVLMVFRNFDRVSYGLIMRSERSILLNDLVTNP